MHIRRTIRMSILAALGVLSVSACRDTNAPQAAIEPIVATPAELAAAQLGVDDATKRVAPSLRAFVAPGTLDRALVDAARAIETKNGTLLKSALIRVDAVLDGVASKASSGGAEAEVDALRLGLADARRLIGPSHDSQSG